MRTVPKFKFPLSVLRRSAGLLQDALTDADFAPAMGRRLKPPFLERFAAEIAAVPGATGRRDSKRVEAADLTDEQNAALGEMERLVAGARRSAKLAFPGETTRLREEFQVGIREPQTLAAEIDRAGKVQAATVKYAAALSEHGWLEEDATAFAAAIDLLTDKDAEQEQAIDERLTLTDEKVAAANALYLSCLTIQNAARLEYPNRRDAAGKAINATARARFLLDEFPPRDRNEPDGGTQGGGAAPPAP